MTAHFLDAFSKKKGAPADSSAAATEAGKRLVFMGTPEMAATLLASLLEHRYQVVGVVSKPDKPVGREQTVHVSPVKHLAQSHNIPVLTPEKLDASFLSALTSLKPDLIVVAAFGKILPKAVLGLPPFGCLNIHTSLLPRWRGASPVQNALLAGDTETGVTLMLMDEGVDTGLIIAQAPVAIDERDTAVTLLRKLTDEGQKLLLDTLPAWFEKKIEPREQNNDEATLCQLIEREDGHVVWSESATGIYNRYRALYPWPGLYTYLKKNDVLLRFKLLEVSCQKQSPQTKHALGEVFEVGDQVGVQAGEGIIFLERVQLEGKKPLPIREFLAGFPELIGAVFH